MSHKCPIPISPLCLTLHFTCVQIVHMVKIDMPAGVGAPPLDTTSEIMLAYNIPTPNDRFIVDSDSGFNIYAFPPGY